MINNCSKKRFPIITLTSDYDDKNEKKTFKKWKEIVFWQEIASNVKFINLFFKIIFLYIALISFLFRKYTEWLFDRKLITDRLYTVSLINPL